MAKQQINNTVDQPIHFLKQVRKYLFRDAIIAGGAIRDRYFNIEPRDYDIFIGIPYHNTLQRDYAVKYLADTLVSCGITQLSSITNQRTLFKHNQTNSYYHCNNVYEIVEMDVDHLKYQFIFVDHSSPIDYVNTEFDVGLCKAYCDGSKLHYTKDFLQDATNKKITIVGGITNEAQLNRTMTHHIPKLQQKFPTFTVEVADHLKQYIQVPF